MATLLTEELLQAVARWRIIARQVPRGGRHAEHRSRALGGGIEFRDFRAYVPGDDLRRVDWNLYRRSGRLFLRLFEEPQDLPVYLLLDVSDSMFFGNPPRGDAARTLAAVLAAVSLNQHDRAGVYPFGSDLQPALAGISTRLGLHRLVDYIEHLGPGGQTDLPRSLAHFAAQRLRPGLVVVISDFFDPRGLAPITAVLGQLRHQLLLAQVTRASDADPELDGELALTDCETGATVEVTVTPTARARYRQAYETFTHGLLDFAARRRATYLRIDADRPVLAQLDNLFRDGVLVT